MAKLCHAKVRTRHKRFWCLQCAAIASLHNMVLATGICCALTRTAVELSLAPNERISCVYYKMFESKTLMCGSRVALGCCQTVNHFVSLR